jgi:hypothetical protein
VTLCSIAALPRCLQVKSKLLLEQQKIAAFEKRKREQESRKFAREVGSRACRDT